MPDHSSRNTQRSTSRSGTNELATNANVAPLLSVAIITVENNVILASIGTSTNVKTEVLAAG